MAAFGSLPQASATASVVVACTSWLSAGGSHARATRIASRASRWASEKIPSSIFSWASVARTVARSGDTSRGTSSTARRAASIAPAGSPAARRMTPRRPWSRPSWTRSLRASSPPMAASRKLVARAVRPVAKAASEARTCRSTRSDGAGPAMVAATGRGGRVRQRQGELERGELVGGGVPGAGEGGGVDGGRAGGRRLVCREPVADDDRRWSVEAHRQRRVVARPRDRQEVVGDRPADPLVADGDPLLGLDQEAVRDGLLETRQQVRVEDAVTRARAAHRARRRPVRAELVGGGQGRQLQRDPGAARRARSAGRRAGIRPSGSPSGRPRGRRTSRSASCSAAPVGPPGAPPRRAAGHPTVRPRGAAGWPRRARPGCPRSARPARRDRAAGGRAGSGGRGLDVIAARSASHGSSRPTTSGWNVPTIASRWSREIRARNVTSARVAASARWRSSMTSRTGLCSPRRPSTPRMLSSVRACRRSGAVTLRSPVQAPLGSSRSPRSGRRRTTSEAPEPSRSARTSSGNARSAGPMARTIAPYGSSTPPIQAVARRTVIGWVRARIRTVASSRNRVTPTPDVPVTIIVRDRPPAASSRRAARRSNASSRPTNRSLVYWAGMAAFYGPRGLGWPS